MQVPIPSNEKERLASLRSYAILDSPSEKAYDDLTFLAMLICETPIALITLIDADRQWFKSKIGVDFTETPRDVSFCAHAILGTELMMISDTSRDERFAANPFVASHPNIRFYAGAPLVSADGYSLGTVCVLDFKPRHLNDDQQEALRALARQCVVLLEHRKLTEEEVAGTKQMFHSLVESAFDGYCVHENGTIIESNQKAYSLFGYDSDELPGTSVLRMIAPEFREMVTEKIQTGDESPYYEVIGLKKDGTRFPLEVFVKNQRTNGGFRRVVVCRDITKRKQLQEELLQSQKMETIGQLAGGVAHDFNNILMAIMGYCDLIKMKLPPGDSSAEHVEETIRAAERGASLTKQLLAFSRKQVLTPQLINLNETLVGMRNLLKRLLGEDVDLLTHLEPNLGAAKVDPSQIEQVIMNLAINARHAMPDGGKLTIGTGNIELDENFVRSHFGARTGPFVRLQISDTGFGMDPETMSHIFEPFFTTKEKAKGSGLGLSTVYGIITQSNGYISVESQPGLGTSFRIYLPRIDEIDSEKARSTMRVLSTDHTILLVDDDEDVRRATGSSLQLKGFRVLEARDGKEAMGIFQNYDGIIELLITDVVMPQMGGRELAAKILAWYPEIKVLFISGYSGEAVIREDSLRPGSSFLQKPVTIETLLEKIHQLLS